MTSAAKRRWKPRHLRRLARALAELAANLAHDLNNQIGAVIALSAELAFHVEGAEDQRALLDRSPERVEVAVQLRQLAISSGRLRDYMVYAAEVFFADVAASAALSGFTELAPETLRTIGTASGRGQELVTAALLQRRLGGELRVEVEGARVTVTFLWPAA
ncbi:MAG: hypothetical protein VYA51_12545, partial [Planctomycetota bacterium]|nr:hypothetical protein [Planctomycetota bacterium]